MLVGVQVPSPRPEDDPPVRGQTSAWRRRAPARTAKNEPLVRHLQQVRAETGVVEEALLELKEGEMKGGEELGVVKAAQELTQVVDLRVRLGVALRIHALICRRVHASERLRVGARPGLDAASAGLWGGIIGSCL